MPDMPPDNPMDTITKSEIIRIRETYPLALRRGDVIAIIGACGLGSEAKYDSLIETGKLIQLRNLPGAKQALYSREHVLSLMEDALESTKSY